MYNTFLSLFVLLLLSLSFVSSGSVAEAQNTLEYQPLTGIYGITQTDSNTVEGDLSKFLTNIFNLTVAVGGILAVIMLMWGGFEYMTMEAVSSKDAAKDRMWGAINGLLFIFFSVAILNVINPDLLTLRLNVKPLEESKTVPPCDPAKADCLTQEIITQMNTYNLVYYQEQKDQGGCFKKITQGYVRETDCREGMGTIEKTSESLNIKTLFEEKCSKGMTLLKAQPPGIVMCK